MPGPSIVQHTSSAPSGVANPTLQYTSNVTAGNWLLALVVSEDLGATISSVSDSNNSGNYTLIQANNNQSSGGGPVNLYAFMGTVGGVKPTITVHSTATNWDLWIWEVTGAGSWGPTVANSAATSGTVTLGTLNIQVPNALMLAFSDASTTTAVSGTPIDSPNTNNNWAQEKTVSAVGSTTLTQTLGTGGWDAVVAAIYPPIAIGYSAPDRFPSPSRQAIDTASQAWPPRVAAVVAPTEAYWSYPDSIQPRHRLHLDVEAFTPPPVVAARLSDAAPREGYASYPERLVRRTTAPDGWTLAGKPERTLPYSDQDFPDRTTRAKTGPDYFTPQGLPITTVAVPTQFPASYPDAVRAAPRGAPDWSTGQFIDATDTQGADWSYPDVLRAPAHVPDVWTTQGAPLPNVAAPTRGYWSYPDRLVRATTAPDGWTLAGKPERTLPYSDQDFPDRVLRARTAPDWSPTVGAPERTTPYSDQDFSDRTLRAKTGPDWVSMYPLPFPTIAAPVEGYWSYPDRVLRATTAPDAWEVPPRPERTAPEASQAFPDRLVRVPPTPDWSPTWGRPEERLPSPWTSYQDQVLRARGGPDWVTVAQQPPVPPSAWASYPDTVRGRPFLTIEQMVETLWPKPIATPATPTWYPDVVRGPLPRQGWDQAFPPQTIIPSARFIVWLGPKPIVVPSLGGGVILPVLGGRPILPVLGKTPV